ncbi:MAG: PAS domain S-box protein [Bacteroidetes bacterium]|nr:PAS domain S-box protein [Bacteroidota bacterium]
MASPTTGSPRAAARRRQLKKKLNTVPAHRPSAHRPSPLPDPKILQTLAAVADGVLVVRRTGIIASADAGACSLLRSSRKRLIGQSLVSLVLPEERSSLRTAWKQLRVDGIMEFRFRTPDRSVSLRCHHDPASRSIIAALRDITAETRDKEARQAAELRYRMFIDNSSEGIWCFGLKRSMDIRLGVKEQIAWFFRYGYLMECNDAYAAMYGFTKAEEITGIMLRDVLDRKDPKNIAYLTSFITSGYRLRETETNERDRNGRIFTVANNLTGMVVNGRLINAWGTQRDVTERNRQEAALKESKESYEGLIRRLPFVVYTWRRTADGRRFIEYVSPQVEQLCGISAGELLAHQERFVSMIHPEDRQVFLERNVESVTTLEPFQYECRAALIGRERWLRFESTPRKMENGDVVWNGMLRDVTERVLAQRALSASEERYRNLVSNLNEGIWVIDAQAVTTMVNPRMAEIVGLPPERIIGRSLFDIVPKEDFSRVNTSIERRKRGVQEAREYTFRHPDGTAIHTVIETYPLTDPDGTYRGAVAAFTDVSEQREAADALRRQNEQLRFLVEASDRLVACNGEQEIYELMADMVTTFIPRSYAFVLSSSADGNTCRLSAMGGVNKTMLEAGKRLQRFDPFSQSFGPMKEYAEKFCSPKLRKYPGGLYETANKFLPKIVARGIEKLTGAQHSYSIGLADGESYLGYIFLLTADPIAVDAVTIESFIHQCYLALNRFAVLRQREQEALRRSILMDTSNDGIAVFSQDHRIIECNPRFCAMLGYSQNELLQMHTWDIEVNMTETEIRRAFADIANVRHTFETHHRRKDGSTFDVEISASGTKIGGIPLIITICRDITERKRMEDALRSSEERLRMYLEHSPAIITLVDRAGRITYINRTEGNYTPADFLGTNIFDTIHPGQHESVRSCLDETIRTGTMHAYETSATVDGETWWYENRVAPLNADRTELLITAINVTEQKRAEEARAAVAMEVRQSEESYRGLFNTVLDAIYIQDEHGVFIDVNEGAEAMYGYSRSEMIGRTPEFVAAPGRNDHLDFPVILRSVMRGANQQFEFWGRRKNGEIFPKDVRLSKGLYFGRPVIIALAQDISARKQMEQDRERQYDELRLLYAFVRDIARDQSEAPIYRHAVEYLAAGMRCPKASILLFDAHGVMQFMDAVGLSDGYKTAAARHSPWSIDTEDPQPIFVADVNEEPSLEALRPVILREGIRALGFIPLLHDGRLIGKFMVYYSEPHSFTEQESRLTQTIAQIVAQAVSRARNAQQLRQSEETLQNIFESLEEGVALNELVYDDRGTIVDYRILEVNRAFEHIALLPREQVIGRLATDIYQMPSEYITSFWNTHLHDSGAVKTDLYTDQIKSWKHVSTSIPKNGRFVTSFFDITEMKNTETALRTSEQYNRSLLETSPNAIAVTDLNGRIVDANARALRLFGFSDGESIIGMDIRERFSPALRADGERHFANLLGGTPIHQLMLPMMCKDGSTFIGEVNGTLVRDASGAPTYSMIVATDITQRVRADEELRLTNAQLKSLINSQTNFVVRTDMKGNYTFVNDQFCRTFGLRREDVIGADSRTTYLSEDTAAVEAVVMQCIAHPGTAFPVTVQKKHPQHGIAQTEWEFIAITDESGAPTEIQCVGHDVTEKHRAIEQLRISEERYRTVANFTYDWEMWIDAAGSIQYVSPSCERICGYGPGEIQADPSLLTAMVHPHDRQRVSDHQQHEFSGHEPHSLEYRILRRNGEERWMNHICRPIVTEDGRSLGRRISMRDITERKRHEEQIRWSEQRYRTMVENIHQAYYESDRFAKFTYCNPGMVILSGYTETELIGMISFRLVADEDRSRVIASYRRWMDAKRQKMSMEFRVRLKDATLFWVEQTTHFEFDEQGSFRKAVNFVKDITERKQAEERLHASELRYRQITEAITDYIYTVTVEGSVVSATKHGPGCLAVTGYAVEEFERDRFLWNTMIVPEDRPMVEARIRAVLENRTSQPVEHRIIRKDGALRWVRNTLVPRHGADGVLISYDGLIQDITERKTAEEGLRHSEARNRALVRTIPDIMFVQDGQGRFLDAHVPETALLLMQPELFIGRTIDELLQLALSGPARPFRVLSPDIPSTADSAEDIRSFVNTTIRPKLRRALETGTMQQYQYSIILGEQKEYFEAHLIAFDDDKILHIIRNVTDKMVYENTLRMMNEELEERVFRRTRQLTEANQELEAFSYSVSHDLRAPLRAIDSFSAMLVEGYEDKFDDEGRRLIGVVRTSIKKMDQLINGLLTLSRIGRNELRPAHVEMGALVRDLLQEHMTDEQRGRYSVIVGKLPACRADETLVRQAMTNLITNAVKYSATVDAPVIVISGAADGEFIRYSVKDNGVGFDPSNTNKLFGIFQRLHTEDQFKGLGIGLSIVQRIVHRHGGRVSAEGQLNGGATFTITLPAATGTQEQAS